MPGATAGVVKGSVPIPRGQAAAALGGGIGEREVAQAGAFGGAALAEGAAGFEVGLPGVDGTAQLAAAGKLALGAVDEAMGGAWHGWRGRD